MTDNFLTPENEILKQKLKELQQEQELVNRLKREKEEEEEQEIEFFKNLYPEGLKMTNEDGTVYYVPATLQRVHDYVTKKNSEVDEGML